MPVADRGVRGQWLWWTALAAGVAWYLAQRAGIGGVAAVLVKGSGVSLLAAWAAVSARDDDGRTIAAVLALGAVGDMLLQAIGLIAGGVAFAIAHLLAIALYLRNRRSRAWSGGIIVAASVPVASIAVTWAMLAGRPGAGHVTLYSAIVGTMAGAAWASRFPRNRTGIGALLFVASDLLIFARIGPLAGLTIADLLVWPLYFAAQALIAHGVVGTPLQKQAR